MANNGYKGTGAILPPQKLPASKKGDQWRENNVDAIDGLASSTAWDGRSSKQRKQINYDLVNSIIDEKDYDYVTDSIGIGEKYGKSPARIRDINMIRQKIELLKGEEITRPFDFMIMCVSGEGVSAREEFERDLVLKTARYMLLKEAGLDPETPEEDMPKSLNEIKKYMQTKYCDMREEYASAVLRNGLEDQRLEFKFSQGFEHALTVAEEMYYVGIVANEPVVRVVNPLYFEWGKGPEIENIQDAPWAREERYMTTSEIIDEYGEFLTEAQVTQLDNGATGIGMMRNSMLPGFGYQMEDMQNNYHKNRPASSNNGSYIRVITCVWKSMKRIGFLRYNDEDGQPQETIVDETRVLSDEEKEMGVELEWQWISETWKGTKVGDDIYIDINPIENQMRTQDNPSQCSLPYVGKTYNNNNSTQTSLVDLLKPHQYMYNIVWYRIENELAKSKGKKLQVDLAQIPKSHGMNLEKWMYYFDNLGIAYINSMEEGKAGTARQGQVSGQQTPIRDLDMSMSNVVQQFMMVLNKLEELIDSISGVSRQREGAIHQNETAGGVERSVTQSSMITEYYFYRHDEIKREVLRQYIEVSKYAYAGGKKIHQITSDMQRIVTEIDGEIYVDSDYNVFPTNATKDKILKSKLEALAPIALQQDKANLSDMVKLYKANSMAEFERNLIEGEQAKEARDAEAAKQQERIAQMQIQAQAEEAQQKRDQELLIAREKNENDLRKAVIQATGFDTDKDRNGDGIADVVQVGEQQLEASRIQGEFLNRSQQRGMEAIEKDKDRQLVREQEKNKMAIEELKAKTALKNKTAGER